MSNADKPAYPIAGSYDDEHPQVIVPVEHGLTKRELIAAMCLQGLLSNSWDDKGREAPKISVQMADALIEELQKEKK